jgi:hypothetical protein
VSTGLKLQQPADVLDPPQALGPNTVLHTVCWLGLAAGVHARRAVCCCAMWMAMWMMFWPGGVWLTLPMTAHAVGVLPGIDTVA